jgi:putative redox protein
LIGFGFGGVLALHQAARDERVAGVACLGSPADLTPLTRNPRALIDRCVRTGVIRSPGYPATPDAWAKEFSILHPREDAAQLKGRPLLVVHGADDPDTPVDDARALAAAASGPHDLREIFGAGHWLRADPRVVAILVGWLERRR